MRQFTCVLSHVANGWHVRRPTLHDGHHLVFSWWLVCRAISLENAPIKGSGGWPRALWPNGIGTDG
jgi:hypothetical protein